MNIWIKKFRPRSPSSLFLSSMLSKVFPKGRTAIEVSPEAFIFLASPLTEYLEFSNAFEILILKIGICRRLWSYSARVSCEDFPISLLYLFYIKFSLWVGSRLQMTDTLALLFKIKCNYAISRRNILHSFIHLLHSIPFTG